MKKSLLIICLLFNFFAWSQAGKTDQKVDWNGYTQLRATSNFDDYSSLMLRRMKFWLKSTPGFSEHWSYKIQTTLSSRNQEKFFLQDVKISYTTGGMSFDIGQFVPAYSLQWSQPDWKIPAIERAQVIDAITPDGSLGVRDLGVQANYSDEKNRIETHFGIFNGYGIKEYRFHHTGYLLTHKTALHIPIRENRLRTGYSLMYRKAENLKIKKVLPDTLVYTGNDFRCNVFARYHDRFYDVQAEFLNAAFDDGMRAFGYYLLAGINYKKSQIVLSFEDYKNTFSTNHKAYYRLGYNYLISKHKIKLFWDNTFQITDRRPTNYMTSVQLQVFLR